MAKFDFDKPVASFSWYLQNGSADDKRGNRLHVGTGQNAQIYFDPKSGEFIGKLKYVDDYIDLADGAKQHFELPRTAREYKPSDFSPKFPISNVKFEVDESVKDFIHVLPRGLFFYQNEFYDAVFGDKTDYPESLKDFLFTRTGDIEAAGEFYGAIEKWPQTVPFRNMRTIGFCRSTTIKSCWRPLKIISDAERVITGRQTTCSLPGATAHISPVSRLSSILKTLSRL